MPEPINVPAKTNGICASTQASAQAWIGLGANLGAPLTTLDAAMNDLRADAGILNLVCSSFYRTAPVDSSGPDYVNAVARVATTLPPHDLLHVLQAIENRHGRLRPYRNAPRTLDLDLLLYDHVEITDAELSVPHPRLHERAFVLVPLAEISPHLSIRGHAIQTLVQNCQDQAIEKLR